MNLFIIGWHISSKIQHIVLDQLAETSKSYPSLDSSKLWSCKFESGSIFGYIPESQPFVNSNVFYDQDTVVFYDGVIVNYQNTFNTQNARELNDHWGEIFSVLEGKFVAIKISIHPLKIEVVNDYLGLYQVYYWNRGKTWLISNSVSLIQKVINSTSFDSLGVNLFLCLGWTGHDRTLCSGVKVIPSAQHWQFDINLPVPKQKNYSEQKTYSENNLKYPNIELLLSRLIGMCEILPTNFRRIRCGLTGGLDTRLLLTILTLAEINAEYFTYGHPDSYDATIAKAIAQNMTLDHQIVTVIEREIVEMWDTISLSLMKQSDGMVNLMYAPDLIAIAKLENSQDTSIYLGGGGGEIVRGNYCDAAFLMGRHGYEKNMIQKYLTNQTFKFKTIAKTEGQFLVKQYLNEFVQNCFNDGIPPADILDFFYTQERMRRWLGNQVRSKNSFELFCTRPLLEVALGMSAQRRYTSPIHYEIIRKIPSLHQLPFNNQTWRSQNVLINLLGSYLQKKIKIKTTSKNAINSNPAFNRYNLLTYSQNHLFLKLRSFCLDNEQSHVWDFVSRELFEETTKLENFNSNTNLHNFFTTVSLMYYDVFALHNRDMNVGNQNAMP